MKNLELNFSETIIKWYRKFGRKEFPWRNTNDPYEILIAELMLQKTHAKEQVLPVFKLFVSKYPNIESLCAAEEREIKKIISSLGLQNVRSHRFKELVMKLKTEFHNCVPNNHDELLSLPGVGKYIANAVLCMAFNSKTVMVDSNFGRVLGRFFSGREEYPPSKKTWLLAKQLMPANNCKEFNLGIIDFGALVCTPINPKCAFCPLRDDCSLYNM